MAASSKNPQEAATPGARLDSWKQIAQYLNRDVRTVQRWERSRGLPVRRVPGSGHAAVYALATELDAWFANGQGAEVEVETLHRPIVLAGSLAAVSIAVLAWWVLGPGGSHEATPSSARDEDTLSSRPELMRLTATPGLDTDPALSPDGTLLAYASDRGGESGFDIWVQHVGGGDPLRVTSKQGDETEPSLSPDGAQIVFSDLESGIIGVIGSLGGEVREVVRVQWARGPRFSPDGRWIVYWKGFLPPVVPRGLPGATGSVFVVSASGGSPRELVPHFASALSNLVAGQRAHSVPGRRNRQ